MKRIAFAVCVVVLVFGVGILAQTQAGSVEQELIKLEKGWLEALLKGDIAYIERILSDDFTDTDWEGNFFTKAQELAELKSGTYAIESGEMDDIKVRIYGDTAVVTGRNTLKGKYKGIDFSGQWRWTDTLVKLAGRWQCVATHGSMIVKK